MKKRTITFEMTTEDIARIWHQRGRQWAPYRELTEQELEAVLDTAFDSVAVDEWPHKRADLYSALCQWAIIAAAKQITKGR